MQKKQGYIYHSKQLKEKFPPQRTHHPAMRLQWSVRLGGLKGEGQPQVKLMVCQQVSGLRITARRFAGRVWMSVPDSGVREILISLFSLKKIKWFSSISLTTLARQKWPRTSDLGSRRAARKQGPSPRPPLCHADREQPNKPHVLPWNSIFLYFSDT